MSWLITPSVKTIAVGGIESTITVDGISYRVHQFTAIGTSSIVFWAPVEVEYLIVAGGGGGGSGYQGGGGGAGGLLTNVGSTPLILSASSYQITVGSGGSTGTSSVPNNGNDSVFANLTANGGGRGASELTSTAATVGGSGGGGTHTLLSGASGTPGQGNAGGNGLTSGEFSGGGGGGAGGVGTNATLGVNQPAGGAGISSSIDGTSRIYAQGGAGARRASAVTGAAGTPNTGNGGGGTSGFVTTGGGAGGSGIVIIRYRI